MLPSQIPCILTHENAELPKKWTSGSSGFDVVLPEDTLFAPMQPTKVNLHVRILIPDGHHIIVKGRSSFAYRHVGLFALEDVIDFDYAGDIHLSVINYSNRDITVNAKKRIAQFFFERTDALDEFL